MMMTDRYGIFHSATDVCDLDEDGDPDALIGEHRRATIWWNEGQAVFIRDRQRLGYSKRHGLAFGDLNGDGRLDILAAAYDDDYRLWLNQEGGTFQKSR